MDKLISYLKAERGRASALAVALNITPGAVAQWREVPADRLVEVERLTGTWTFPALFSSNAFSVLASLSERSPASVVEGISPVTKIPPTTLSLNARGVGSQAIQARTAANTYVSGDFVWVFAAAIGRWF
jgi:hypothetical protein